MGLLLCLRLASLKVLLLRRMFLRHLLRLLLVGLLQLLRIGVFGPLMLSILLLLQVLPFLRLFGDQLILPLFVLLVLGGIS
jgi:hypothetical protein